MENVKSVELSWRQLAEHNKEGDAWLAIRGQVYDVTSWVNAHPGGKDTILLNAVRPSLSLSIQTFIRPNHICAQNLRSNFGYAIAYLLQLPTNLHFYCVGLIIDRSHLA